MSKEQDNGPTKAMPTVEKAKSTNKEKAQKQVEGDKSVEASAKSKGIAEGTIPKEKKMTKPTEKKEKRDEEKEKKHVKKRKIELDKLELTERTNIRTRRKLIDENPKSEQKHPHQQRLN